MALLLDRQHTALAALHAVGADSAGLSAMSDEQFLELARLSGEMLRLASAQAALIAGDAYRRSAPSLGSAGLAQSTGHRTPRELVRSVTGVTKSQAAQAIAVGRITTGDDERAWLAPVGLGVSDGSLSAAAAQAIANGLAGTAATDDELGAAAVQLCEEAAGLDADRLFQRARQLRDELDETGIADRERIMRDRRSFTMFRRPDGSYRAIWDMDPETGAEVCEIRDRATSPRMGGPRFDSPDAVRITDDPRTTEQLASDVFLALLRAGADADSSQLLGSGAPAIRVIVTAAALESRTGHGRIEGQTEPISIETVERLACTGSSTEIRFTPTGQPLDVGREQRLYTRTQRIALAARDGGCRWPGCERPPSWTEAHHINHWARDGGRTDIADGVLLCRHHHLLIHNNHWEIERRGVDLWLIPPEAGRDPVPMREPAVRKLLSA